MSTSSGGKYGTILPVKSPRDDLEVTSTFMYTIFNEPFHKAKNDFPAMKEDFEFAKMFMEITEGLLKDGKLKTHPEKVGNAGLEGALRGMEDMKADKVSHPQTQVGLRKCKEDISPLQRRAPQAMPVQSLT